MFWTRLNDAFKILANALLDFVYPPYCSICGSRLQEGERLICERCWGEVEPLKGPFCPNCGYPVENSDGRCPMCQQRSWNFHQVAILADFRPPMQQLIHLLKYQGKRSIGKRLGEMLAQVLVNRPGWQAAEVIIPVPLHKTRLRERGYNQSFLIAQALSERVRKPLRAELLVRKRNTRSQTRLNVAERIENVAEAFIVNHPEALTGKRVILVDDVITTGATADACSIALLNAGAKEVLVAAVATPVGYS